MGGDGFADDCFLRHQLSTAPGYTLLIWAVQVAEDHSWDQAATLRRLAGYLTKWFFWRNLTDFPSTRDLDPLFIELIDQLLTQLRAKGILDQNAFINAAMEWLNVRAAPKELRERNLNGDLYEENYDVTRFMLCKIEESHQTRETLRDLWTRDSSGKPIFTVEHILPKSERLSDSWTTMLANGDSTKAAAIRERCAHKLGNLTLSGYNSKLGKMDYRRKRDRKNDAGDYIGYRNGLYLNNELASREDWTEDVIVARSEKLLQEVRILFSLEPLDVP